MISTIGKILVNVQDSPSPLHAPNLAKFVQKMAENGWQVFAHPRNFGIARHCQPYSMEVILAIHGHI